VPELGRDRDLWLREAQLGAGSDDERPLEHFLSKPVDGGSEEVANIRLLALSIAGLVLLMATLASASPQLRAGRCPIFPRDNPWNQRVDRLPVARNSAQIIRSIGAQTGLHPDFGSGLWAGEPIGIPITVVSGTQRKVPVSFEYADESDAGPYPIPAGVRIEGGDDRHAIILDRDACRLYELYALRRGPDGRWQAGSGAIWNLRSNRLRPAGWTSADGAGLPILAGLARYDEVLGGRIDHALRFTAERTRRAYVYPARHYASDLTSQVLPPMGLRVRLRAGFPVRNFPPQARVVLEALQRHGMILADNGSSWFITGAPDSRWDNDDLHTLSRVKGSDFEVVDTRTVRPRR
jgi:hypothetical protein